MSTQRKMIRLDEPEDNEVEDQNQTKNDEGDRGRSVLSRGHVNEYVSHYGITFQRCGGGRRIIRKSRGNY